MLGDLLVLFLGFFLGYTTFKYRLKINSFMADTFEEVSGWFKTDDRRNRRR